MINLRVLTRWEKQIIFTSNFMISRCIHLFLTNLIDKVNKIYIPLYFLFSLSLSHYL